jgi:hypothetical protein
MECQQRTRTRFSNSVGFCKIENNHRAPAALDPLLVADFDQCGGYQPADALQSRKPSIF